MIKVTARDLYGRRDVSEGRVLKTALIKQFICGAHNPVPRGLSHGFRRRSGLGTVAPRIRTIVLAVSSAKRCAAPARGKSSVRWSHSVPPARLNDIALPQCR